MPAHRSEGRGGKPLLPMRLSLSRREPAYALAEIARKGFAHAGRACRHTGHGPRYPHQITLGPGRESDAAMVDSISGEDPSLKEDRALRRK